MTRPMSKVTVEFSLIDWCGMSKQYEFHVAADAELEEYQLIEKAKELFLEDYLGMYELIPTGLYDEYEVQGEEGEPSCMDIRILC